MVRPIFNAIIRQNEFTPEAWKKVKIKVLHKKGDVENVGNYALGTWAPTKEHERMLQSAQRKMLRLIIQTKRRYKKIAKHKVRNSENINDIDSSCTNDESEDRKSDTSHNDQDSDVSFEIDNDEEIDAAEIKEEEWVEYIKKEHH